MDVSTEYRNAGLCVLPAIRADKRPATPWKQYQHTLPTDAQIRQWFRNPQDAVCVVAGGVSGNVELIDFDLRGELFEVWAERIPEELLSRLVIESSQSGGKHVIYRCEAQVNGNMKLAQTKEI